MRQPITPRLSSSVCILGTSWGWYFCDSVRRGQPAKNAVRATRYHTTVLLFAKVQTRTGQALLLLLPLLL